MFGDKAAITGIGETAYTRRSVRSAVELMLEAARAAMGEQLDRMGVRAPVTRRRKDAA